MAPGLSASDPNVAMSSRLHQLSALGQSVWIDYLSRDLIESGALEEAIDKDAVVGVTSNPSIFEKALAHGHSYDEQIAASDTDARNVFLELAMRDVATACDLLRAVWDRTQGADGYVSKPVDIVELLDTVRRHCDTAALGGRTNP